MEIGEDKNKEYVIYFISCFNKSVWDKKIGLRIKNTNITVANVFIKNFFFIKKEYHAYIHKVKYNDFNQLFLQVYIFDDDNKDLEWDLKKINLKEGKRLYCNNLEINPDYKIHFSNYFNNNQEEQNELDIDNNLSDVFYKSLNTKERLELYLKYFMKEEKELNDYIKKELVELFVSNCKENNIIEYSELIKIFSLSFKTKKIKDVLDVYPSLNIQLDVKIEDKAFNIILDMYKKNNNSFLEENKAFFIIKKEKGEKDENKKQNEKYKKLLENFMILYQLFYEAPERIEKTKLKNIKLILEKLINNKNDFTSYISFILNKFKSFSVVFSSDKTIKNEGLIIKEQVIKNDNKIIGLEQFISLYNIIIEEQEKNGYFLNFSEIFNYFYDKSQVYKSLILIKKEYEKELKHFPNKDFEKKIIKSIHKLGLEIINKGEYSNAFIIYFIENNEYYTNESYKGKKEKDFSILQYFKIEEMDDNFFNIFEAKKIYLYFKENFKKYLEIFCTKIQNILYFDYFFKLLPKNKYDTDTTKLLYTWLISSSISDFNSSQQFINLAPGIGNLINIMLDKELNEERITKILEFLKIYMGKWFFQLIIYLLNIIEKKNNEILYEYLIKYLLSGKGKDKNYSKNDDNLDDNTFKNIEQFLNEIKTNKLIIKIFFLEIQNKTISINDFFEEHSLKFSLFQNLLYNNDYTLLSNDENKKSIYWINTEYTCKKLSDLMINLDIEYVNIKFILNLIGKENTYKRIISIFKCLNREDEATIVKEKIKNAVDKFDNDIRMIEKLKEYNILIYYDNFENNVSLSKYNKELINSKLKYIYSEENKNKFSKYINDIHKANEILPLKNSNLFLNIFNEFKKKFKELILIEMTLENLKNIKKILVNDTKVIESELKTNSIIKYLISIGYQGEEILSKEIDWLKTYYKINEFNEECKNFLIDKIQVYIKNKSLYSIISGILIILENYKKINNNEDNTLVELEKELKEYKSLLSNKKFILIDQFQKINENIEKYFKIKEQNKKLFFDIFILLNKYQGSINFLLDKKHDEVGNMFNYLMENDDITLKNKDKEDFIKVISYFEGQKKYNTNFIDFVSDMINVCNNSLMNYISKYSYIKELFDKYLKNNEGYIAKVKDILNNSKFIISLNNKSNIYEMSKGFYIINNQNNREKEIEILYENLEYLFQKIILSKSSLIIFINFFQNLNKILNTLNEIHAKGYQEIFKIEIKIEKKEIYCIYNSTTNSIDKLLKDLLDLKTQIIQKLKKIYNDNEIIRLFYGRQLYFIYNNLKLSNENKNIDLFKIISNNNIKSLIYKKFEFGQFSTYNEYFYIIQQLSDYFEENLTHNKKTIKDIYKFNIINENIRTKNHKKFRGIYYNVSNNQDIDSLNYYLYLTNNFPINICFLYCTNYITSEELLCFLLRCVLCQYNALFCLINADLLNITQRRNFISLIKEFSKKYGKKMMSCLLIMLNISDNILHKIFNKIKNIQPFPLYSLSNQDKISSLLNQNETFIINSTNCGLGKSELIKTGKIYQYLDKQFNKDTNYIYFPIGGQFSRHSLINRLNELPDMSNLGKEFTIHLDLTQTKDFNLLNEFFFKLLILRQFDLYENVKYLGKNVKIIIELLNDFKNYRNEIKILSFLFNYKIFELTNFNPSPELTTVATFLSTYEMKENQKKYDKNNIDKNYLNLSNQKCKDIILKNLNDIGIKEPNYYQINIFIKVLYDEFKQFSNCHAITPNNLRSFNIEPSNIRKFIIDSLVKLTKLFILGPYEDLIKDQEINKKLLNSEKNEEKEKLINYNLKININSISFDQIKPSILVFNEDGNSISIIATCSENEQEFHNLEQLYNSQNIDKTKLKNFQKLESQEILNSVLSFLNCKIDKSKIPIILGNYVYTPDNFIKVVLILMRIRVKIPVILMGETGCGKTTLIEMASKLKFERNENYKNIYSNTKKSYIKKMNIHAGITDEDIIQFFTKIEFEIKNEDNKMINAKKKNFENMPEKYKKAYLKNNTQEKIFSEYEKEIKERDIWIFFDEINTCNSMALFIEIFCKNSIYGKPLDKRYIYIAACNPYRVTDKKNIIFNVLYKKNYQKKNLVYTVNPLPISLLNFVFNFGSLKDKDEVKYIESMISEATKELSIKYNLGENEKKELIKFGTKCVNICHNYMKQNNDISIVSLREVNRYNVFFKFFFEYIINRKNNENLLNNSFEADEIIEFYKNKTIKDLFYYSINLSLFICYYLRLPDKKAREELKNVLNENKGFSNNDFLKVPLMEQNYLTNNLDIPIGIAKNRNLKENLFILFFCIINKIPIITLGKPGMSKTLSYKILEKSMRGIDSKSIFIQQYKELKTFRIQGSLYTTSSEIINIFKSGRDYQKKNLDKIVVIYIDEMGLAEISENNPLKVLHSELENEEDKISFIGISNWFIDASKMNRVIYNVVQDPDLEDIIETGKEITKAYEKNEENYLNKYGNIILNISKAYYNYISKRKENYKLNQYLHYFHGSRDFFSIIKSIMNEIIKNENELNNQLDENKKNELLIQICLNNIERNFAGLEDSIKEFKSLFLEQYDGNLNNYKIESKYNVLKCIEDNINDKNSRYLLLIIDNNMSHELLNYILEQINEKKELSLINQKKEDVDILNNNTLSTKYRKDDFKKYYIGSKFKADKNSILYYNEILNKIKEQMEREQILILKDLENIYPALYELFNQSFEYLPGKKFVYLGESKSQAIVDDNFKVIVIIEKNQIQKQEAPFLNRFEKHIFNYSVLLSEELIDLSEEIYNVLTDEIYETLKIIKNPKDFINNNEKKNNNDNNDEELKKIKNLKDLNDNNENINNNDNIYEELKKYFKKYCNFIKLEEIKGLVYIGSKQKDIINENKKIDKNKIIKYVLEKISPCFNEKIMILITKYGFKKKFEFYYKCILEAYKKKYCYNIKDYLKKLDNNTSIIYTYSSIIDEIINYENEIIENKLFNKFSESSTKEININNIYSMEQINREIFDFINEYGNIGENEKNLLLLKFEEEDLNKLNDIYYLLKDHRMNSKREMKVVIFVIYLEKNTKHSNYISFLSNCPQIMINNFNNQYNNILEIIDISSNEDIIEKQLFTYEKMMIDNNIEEILSNFSFNLINCDDNNFFYKKLLIDNIKENKYIKDILINCLKKIFKNEEDYIIKIFNEITLKEREGNKVAETEFLKIFNKDIKNLFIDRIKKLIYILEKEQLLNAIINNEKIYENEIIKNNIDDFISRIYNGKNKEIFLLDKKFQHPTSKIIIPVILNQKLPFFNDNCNSLFNYINDQISNTYLDLDNKLIRKVFNDFKIEEEKKNYINGIKKLDNFLKIEISKFKMINDILNSKNKDKDKLITYMFEDCFYIFFKNNNKLLTKYDKLSEILNLLIQLRLKTRMNDNLTIDFIKKDKIKLESSFMVLIEEENKNNDNHDNEKENNLNYDNNIYLNKFVSIVNFLQSYSKEIYQILEFYYYLLESFDLNKNENDDLKKTLFDEVKYLIENKKIEMDNSSRNRDYNKINKLSFFYIIASLAKIFQKKLLNFLNSKTDSKSIYNLFCNSFTNYVRNLLRLEKKFLLFTSEIFSLDIINKIIYAIKKKMNNEDLNISEEKFFYETFESTKVFFEEDDKIFGKIINEKEKKDKNIIEKIKLKKRIIYKIFKQDLNCLNEYCYLINRILVNSYKCYNKDEFRINLIEYILFDNSDSLNKIDDIIEYSYPLIKLIFKFKDFEPKKATKVDNKDNKDKLIKDFFDNFNKVNDIKAILNNKNNSKLNEIFLYRFEIVCDQYFKKIYEKKKEINKNLGKNSSTIIYLEEVIKFLNNENKEIKLKNICNLFCIAFIKIFLKYYIDILLDEECSKYFTEYENINEILFSKKYKILKNVKYYLLKLFFNKCEKNWDNFIKHFNFNEKEKDRFGLGQYLDINLEEDESLSYIPILLLDKANQNNKDYNELLSKNKLNQESKKVFDNLLLKNNLYQYLYSFLSNIKIFSYCITKPRYKEKKDNYNNLLLSINEYLPNKIDDKDILDFINLLFEKDETILKNKIFPKMNFNDNIDDLDKKNKITILLYAFRFIFSVLLHSKNDNDNPDNFYFKILSKNITSIIDNSFIPGNFPFTNLKIQSFEKVKQLFKNTPKNDIYLCSCGYSFIYSQITKNVEKMKCPTCQKYIIKNKQLCRRKGNIKIYLDEELRNNSNIPNKLLNELEREVNTSKRKLDKGLKPIKQQINSKYLCNNIYNIYITLNKSQKLDEPNNKYLFIQNDEIIREMNNITYRLLNFILYSFLFYSNIKGDLSDKHLKKYIIDSMTCFEMMEEDWKLMETNLQKYNIRSVEIFLNLIFDDIIEKLIKCPNLKIDKKQTINFEKDIDLIIMNKIKQKNLITLYKKQNTDLIDINPNLVKTIIEEIYPPEIYSEDKYPDFKYFYILEFPSKKNFITKFFKDDKNQLKYPIINSIIAEDEIYKRMRLLKYLPKINKFCNYMFNYVSFKYTRREAKNIKFEDAINDNEINLLLKDFISIYNEIRPYIKIYENNIDLSDKFNDLENNLYLSNLCVDSFEVNNYGYILYEIYKEMILWQNLFIKIIINSPNDNLKLYKDYYNSVINVQDCQDENLVLPSFEEIKIKEDKSEKNNNCNEFMKSIFNKSHRIGKEIIYNFEKIEEKLALIILPNLKLFDKKKIKKVIYKDEIMFNENYYINFITKYEQKKLCKKEIEIIVNYLKNNKNFDIKSIIFSLHYLISDILESTKLYDNEKIYKITNIETIKEFFNSLEDNINNEDNLFTVNCLIDLIDILELLSWDNIKKSLKNKYNEDIDNNIKSQMKQYFDQNNKKEKEKVNEEKVNVEKVNEEKINEEGVKEEGANDEIVEENVNEEDDNEEDSIFMISKDELCSALRKFIIRYLLEAGDNQINLPNNLKNYLKNNDLWPIYFIENNNIDEEQINLIFGNVKVDINQAAKLYEYLGGEKSKLEKLSLTYNINLNFNNEKRKSEDKNLYNDEDIKNNIILGEKNMQEEEHEEELEEEHEEEQEEEQEENKSEDDEQDY